ncbi:MAG: bifunctional tetrahydrofolate synthase/dihydrofolate synthase [Halobacteria archaeon]|nr:bifunctional tetrahydrofolate synthase/dihydrofolate synthase [Halobacteria archaeon]
MRFTTLDEWLSWQETLHPTDIELGLERVATVFQQLHADNPPFPVITVAGTNGKGSSVAMLEAILLAAGYRVGAYTSPHLLTYNERVRLGGEPVSDALLMESFARIDDARKDTSLTYFEFATLAALDIFYRQAPDVVVLEVGLGGRLDAVNIMDPDVALITSISMDHAEWLGDDREAIAIEKAGIMRAGRPVVFSGRNMPASLAERASALGASLSVLGREFDFQTHQTDWQWQPGTQPAITLPHPALAGNHQLDNAAGVLMVLSCLAQQLPISEQAMQQGLRAVSLPGRFQIIAADVTWVLDVAHNPDGVARLAELLAATPVAGRTLGVIGMMQDKDIPAVVKQLQPEVDAWYTAKLPSPRSAEANMLAEIIRSQTDEVAVVACPDVSAACEAAKAAARDEDRILVCGSFYTVAAALSHSI